MTEQAGSSRRGRSVVLGAAGVAAAAAAYGVSRVVARHRAADGAGAGSRVGPVGAIAAADPDLEMPTDVTHHRIEMGDGTKLHVVESGSGPAIVLLHGAGLSCDVWAYQFRDLAPGHRLVALDLRGHGASEGGLVGGQLTIDHLADDLAVVLESLDLRDALLVGHSMGGMAVLRLARLRPDLIRERVRSVLLLSTAARVLPEGGLWATVWPVAAKAVVDFEGRFNRSGRLALPAGRVGTVTSRLGFGSAPAPAQVAATLRMLRATRPSVHVGLFPAILGFDEAAEFSDPGVPVTVLVGDRDRLTPPALAEQLAAALPGAELLVWHGGGHMLMFEQRDSLDRLLDKMAARPAEQGRQAP